MPTLLEDLVDWLRIPSVSTGGGDPDALRRACDWVCERIDAAGGAADAVAVDGGNPMAVGELPATEPEAPNSASSGWGVKTRISAASFSMGHLVCPQLYYNALSDTIR